MAEVSGIQVTIGDDGENPVKVNPATGTVETKQDDGGVVVQLDAHRPAKDDDDGDPFYENLADQIDPQKLSVLANDLCDQISADDRSRGNHLEIRKRIIELLGFEIKEP